MRHQPFPSFYLCDLPDIAAPSAAAQAGERSLSFASSPEPVATEVAVETPKTAEAPTFVERPAAVQTKAESAKAEQDNPAIEKTASAPKVEKSGQPKRKRYWTEARIIHELHRHGIYW